MKNWTIPSSLKKEPTTTTLLDLYEELDDVWKGNIWRFDILPLTDQDSLEKIKKWKSTRKLEFNKSDLLNKEMKLVIFNLLLEKKWTVKYLSAKRQQLYILFDWFDSKFISLSELMSDNIEHWRVMLRTFMVNQGTYEDLKRTTLNSSNEIKEYPREPLTIYMFNQFYKTIVNLLEEKSEFEKDVWDIRKLKKDYDKSTGNYTLSFEKITQGWLKNLSKKFIIYRLSKYSFSNAQSKLNGFKYFSSFLTESKSNITSLDEINQNTINNFSEYLNYLEIKTAYKSQLLGAIKDFLLTSTVEEWFYPKESLIVNIPKIIMTKEPKYIPDHVLKQLNNLITELRPDIMRIVLLLQVGGMRISEILLLPFSPLIKDQDGDYFLQYYSSKLKKDNTIPIPHEAAEIIRIQQESVIEKFGAKSEYLFPSKFNTPILQKNFNANLNTLSYEKRITDSEGKLFHFHSHQFRHTVGTRLINLGVPQHIVQEFLGHESPAMTSVYAEIHDKTLKDKFVETKKQVVNIYGDKGDFNNEINEGLQWLKKNILAQTLPNGYCSIPVIAGPCSHANACLTCEHFRTDGTFKHILIQQLEDSVNLIEIAKQNEWKRQIETNTKIKNNLEAMIKSL
jgi:integrase